MASDPDEEFEIDMEASDLQLNSDRELRQLRETYGFGLQSQIPAQIHAEEEDSGYDRNHHQVAAVAPMHSEPAEYDCGIIQNN